MACSANGPTREFFNAVAASRALGAEAVLLEDKDVSIEALRGHEEAERVILATVQLYADKVAELR